MSFYVVVDNAAIVDIGEAIIAREGVQVTINCTQLINNKINSGVQNPTVAWSKDGVTLKTGSDPNVVLSKDRKLCIITSTLLTLGDQAGNDGNYNCEVCGGIRNCNNKKSNLVICGKSEYFNNFIHTYSMYIFIICIYYILM